MADRIIRGYWDCPRCGRKGIDGLADICPACGSAKDKDVRYYMKEVEEVTDQELADAGLSREESDGEHREWICAFCGSLNNYRDHICVHCGADKDQKEQDYGGDTHEAVYVKDSQGRFEKTGRREEAQGQSRPDQAHQRPDQAGYGQAHVPVPSGRSSNPLIRVLLIAGLLVMVFLLWPHTESEAITGFKWNRAVTVEELQTFSESGWSVPYNGRVTGSRMELAGYRQVVDHYETVYVTKSREVLDHYDTSYEYTDNGNGTFTEHPVYTPIYTTEYYKEAEQQPVYRREPVYQTKYYYEIDRWIVLDTYRTSGEDHDPYWSSEYTLNKDRRDVQRQEEYYTIYNDTDIEKTSYDKWKDQEIGDGIYVTRCRLGIEYSRKEKG